MEELLLLWELSHTHFSDWDKTHQLSNIATLATQIANFTDSVQHVTRPATLTDFYSHIRDGQPLNEDAYTLSNAAIKFLKTYPFPPEVCLALAHHPHSGLRLGLAENCHATPHSLDVLARDTQHFIRERVANNPHTSPDTLDWLARHGNMETHLSIVHHHHTRPETFRILATESTREARQIMARNTSTPSALLHLLTHDEVASIRHSAYQTLAHSSPR